MSILPSSLGSGVAAMTERTLSEQHRKLAKEYEYAMQNFQFDRVLGDGSRQNPNAERFRQSMVAHREAADALDAKSALLAEVMTALEQMIRDCTYLCSVLEGKAIQDWNCEYIRERVNRAHFVLTKLKSHPTPELPS
jgi:hypothetical protein